MHILPHISLFLLALSRFASFMLSWCSLLNVSNDHSVNATTPFLDLLTHSCPHFQFICLHTVSVLNPLYCTVSCCTMWLSFATLPVIVWKRRRASSPSLSFCLSVFLSPLLLFFYPSASLVSPLLSRLSLSLSLSVSLSVLSSSLSSLCFFTILSLLSRPGMQVTYEFSLSMHLPLICSLLSSDRCSIGYNLPLCLFFTRGHK